MIVQNVSKHVVVATALTLVFAFLEIFSPKGVFSEANAETTYNTYFKVSAYYSPIPGQKRYIRGSYAADQRLNGKGIRGASGAPVFPGMIAAPRTYAFGTKIDLQGLGIGTVEDRGGAIVSAGNYGHAYDRLDIWMGYGDAGLERALKWGIRTIPGRILGQTDHEDTVDFMNFKNDSTRPPEVETVISTIPTKQLTEEEKLRKTLDSSFPTYMGRGVVGKEVHLLQHTLKRFGYFKGDMTGEYDTDTVNAVYNFQLQKRIIKSPDEFAAGYFGVKTRETLIDLLANKKVEMKTLEAALASDPIVKKEKIIPKPAIVSKKNDVKLPLIRLPEVRVAALRMKLDLRRDEDMKDNDKKEPTPKDTMNTEAKVLLQKKLRSLGHYEGEYTGKLDTETRKALLSFQKKTGLKKHTGYINKETTEALERVWNEHVSIWGISKDMSEGANGNPVKTLQTFLKNNGYYRGDVDGKFGSDLRKSVILYQLKNGIVKSAREYGAGFVGNKTVTHMNNKLFRLED